jgi:hypothetical protein
MQRQRAGSTLQWVGGIAWIIGCIGTGGLLLIPTGIIAGVIYLQRPTCFYCKHRIKRGVPVCRFCHKTLSWPNG